MTARRVVVTGANRGLGFGLVDAFIRTGMRVIAVARDPETARLQELRDRYPHQLESVGADVTDDSSVATAARAIGAPIDLLVNNAGINPGPRNDLDGLDFDDARAAFEVNVLGVLRVTRQLLPALLESSSPVLVHVTSKMGSIGMNDAGGALAYRMSKAALNMAHQNLTLDLGARGVTCVVVHPGWVRTDMVGPDATLSIDDSVSKLVPMISSFDRAAHGRFFDVSGEEIPW
ncbi:MAG: SDR family oxidoreductase [Planctomycetes bacterium]|nr:SDR family oxidoreductase [Planctomycetota bacterium]